jgi:hypothetical protein
VQQFTPCANHQIVMTGSSVNQALTAPGVAASSLYLYNGGTVVIAVRWGIGAQTALTTDFPMAPGAYFVIGKGVADNVAAIGASGTLYISPGEGQ